MGKKCDAGEFENPAFGCWATSLSFQLVVSLLCFILALNPYLPEEAQDGALIPYISVKVFTGLGVVHLVVFSICTVLCLLGFLFSTCFQCPLMISGIVFQLASLATAGIIGKVLSYTNSSVSTTLDALREGNASKLDFSVHFAVENEGILMSIAVICLIIPVFICQAKTLSASSPGYQANLYPVTILTSLACAGMFIFFRVSESLLALSCVWLIVTIIIGGAVCCTKSHNGLVISIIVIVLFVLGAFYSIISGFTVISIFDNGRSALMRVKAINPSLLEFNRIDDVTFSQFRTFMLARQGTYLIVELGLSFASLIFFVYSALATLRSVCGPKRNAVSQEDPDEGRANGQQA